MSGALLPHRVLVGMEVHLQLRTRTKCFSAAPVGWGAEPNTLVDPVVLGLPGALPVLSREAVRQAVRTGLALGAAVAEVTKWDRKNYFYPDLPKGYQISQYDQPLCTGGAVEIDGDDGLPKLVRIRRAHLEEDTGKSMHDAGGDKSRIDLNRAGTPLLEIVSEPDIASAEEAERYLEALREIVAWTGTSEGNMEKGHLRCEPNVNVVLADGTATPIVEIKNVNSVKGVGRAIRHEVERQLAAWSERGETAANTPRSTRGWDEDRGVTVHQRAKESADDYRYFPEPDLPPLRVARAFVERERSALPELPRARRARYVEALGLTPYDAGVLTADPALAAWFEEALQAPGTREPRALVPWITGELLRHVRESGRSLWAPPPPAPSFPAPPSDQAPVALGPADLAELVDLVQDGTVSLRSARDLLRESLASGVPPARLARERGVARVTDHEVIEQACRDALEAEPQAAQDVRAGQQRAFGRLMGAAMKALEGRGDPSLVQAALRRLLAGDSAQS